MNLANSLIALRYGAILIASFIFVPSSLSAQEWTATSNFATSALWPAAAGTDNSNGTYWSSNPHTGANTTEGYAFWFGQFKTVNYVRFTPRAFGDLVLGFPTTFSIYCSNGSSWQIQRTITSMPNPYRYADVILALPVTVSCDGIYVVASVLGRDDVGNFVFQMDNFRAGFNSAFRDRISFIGNNGGADSLEVSGVGADNFDPNRMANWNYDIRNPILPPKAGPFMNIYNASVVQDGSAWNVYFGGFDGSSIEYDEVSRVRTTDRFETFSAHQLTIPRGPFAELNNPNVKKLGPSDWRMAYTTLDFSTLRNKPGFASSTDGNIWSPTPPSYASLMTMTGYPNWPDADVNGGNVIFRDAAGTFHMYFDDFHNWGVHHATSADNQHYTYVATTWAPDGVVVNDVQSFTHEGDSHFVWTYHNNQQTLWYSVSQDLAAPGPLKTLFSTSPDDHMVSVGLVKDGNRLIGALYGAGTAPTLNHNQIYARWLQKKIVFNNVNRLLAAQNAKGPDKISLYMVSGKSVETGTFRVYAEDGTSEQYLSPEVTVIAGDIWQVKATPAEVIIGDVTANVGSMYDVPLGGASSYRSGGAGNTCPFGYALVGTRSGTGGFWLCARSDLASRTFYVGDVEGNVSIYDRVSNGTLTTQGTPGSFGWNTCINGSSYLGRWHTSDGFWICMQ